MSVIDKFKSLPKAKKIAFAGIGAVLIVGIIVAVILISNKGYTATTMRLLRVEGTVNIEDSKGGTKPVLDKIRFQSGDALNTGNDGLASVGLDDTKIVTLQSDSRVEFQKQNKKLELKLTKGALFFEVMEHLKDDETYEIHTSNMTVGIRGTSGYVYYDESDKRESLVVTDGVVEVSATNPKTGETKTARVEGGKQIKVYLYSDRTEDTVEFELNEVSEESVPEFALQRLAENEELLDRVCEYTGWDKDKLIEVLADAIAEETAETSESTEEPTPTPTPDPEDEGTPTDTPAPTITPPPTATPTATPTARPSGAPTITPTAGATATATATPTATVTATATPTSGATTTAAPTDTPIPTPEVKAGCTVIPYGWDTEYNGRKVYLCHDGNRTIYGYVDGEWVKVVYNMIGTDQTNNIRVINYKIRSTEELYYVHTGTLDDLPIPGVTETPTATATPTAKPEITPEAGYSKETWGAEYTDIDSNVSRTVYIETKGNGRDAVYRGYVEGTGWVDLDYEWIASNGNGEFYSYYYKDTKDLYYFYKTAPQVVHFNSITPTATPTATPAHSLYQGSPAYINGILSDNTTDDSAEYKYLGDDYSDGEYYKVLLNKTEDKNGNECYYCVKKLKTAITPLPNSSGEYYYFNSSEQALYLVPDELCP